MSKKKRKQRQHILPKRRPAAQFPTSLPIVRQVEGEAGTDFQVGDSVVVKPGVQDPDFGANIGGWQGRITSIEPGDGDVMLTIEWDSLTLHNMPDEVIEQCEEEGLSWTVMNLAVNEVELAQPRDSEQDVERASEGIGEKHSWDWLGEEGARIQQVLAGIDLDDEMALLRAWKKHLAGKLKIPFEAEVSEFQDRGPLQAGDRVKVTGISALDDGYGLIVHLRMGRREYDFPLCDLEVIDERSSNYQPVHDYAVWFANR